MINMFMIIEVKIRTFVLCLSLIIAEAYCIDSVCAKELFDHIRLAGKPDLQVYGLKPIAIAYGGQIWSDDESRKSLPNKQRVQALVRELRNTSKEIVLDIESWEVTGTSAGRTRQMLATVISWVREAVPDAKLCLYSLIPNRNVKSILSSSSSVAYQRWVAGNDRMSGLVNQLDFLCPSLYVTNRTADDRSWVVFAKRMITEAKRLAKDKPVIGFLRIKNEEYRYHAKRFWEEQLDITWSMADGIVLWGGLLPYKKGKFAGWGKWDANSEWWRTTIDFAVKKGVGPASAR